eukprot:8015682-Pyramimonas_sp.AAC.1
MNSKEVSLHSPKDAREDRDCAKVGTESGAWSMANPIENGQELCSRTRKNKWQRRTTRPRM